MASLSEETAIERIKQARAILRDDVVILGHHYQRDSVIQFADFRGDSYQLSKTGTGVTAQYIIFAGVYFMAEVAAILARPSQVVILPNLKAGCSLADTASLKQVTKAWNTLQTILGGDLEQRVMPITYVNSAADLKAFVGERGGMVCTSSNAHGALQWALEQREKVFFFPDQHLGRNTGRAMEIPLDQMVLWNRAKRQGGLDAEQLDRARIILWDGECCVHQGFTPQDVDRWKAAHPDGHVIVHPECPMEVVDKADYTGSTSLIIHMIEAAPPGSQWAIGTEYHLVNRLKNTYPDKQIEMLSAVPALCRTMDMTTPSDLAHVLEGLVEGRIINPITVPDHIAQRAKLALDRMLEIT
jgi:quinolinate synthase